MRKNTNKKERHGNAGRNGERKIGGNVTTGCLGERGQPGRRSGCRVWLPSGQSILGRTSKGVVKEEESKGSVIQVGSAPPLRRQME